MEKLAPFLFALDATNYSRWLPVHIHNMKYLPNAIKTEFKNGLWTVTRSAKKFSSIAIDQAHEQTNKILKGTGGALGLYDNEKAFMKWMIVTPELSRMIQEFETFLPRRDHDEDELFLNHHEQSTSFQKTFHDKAKKFYDKVCEYGNPFTIEHESLLTLNTQEICDDSVVDTIKNLESRGTTQYNNYVQSILETGKKSIHDVISKNSFPLMSTPLKKISTTAGNKLKVMKLNSNIFSSLVAVLQQREISLERLFSYELHSFPPAISEYGQLNLPGNKAALVHEIVTNCHNATDVLSEFCATATLIIDGGKIPYQFTGKPNMTFRQYADIISKMLMKKFDTFKRIDIVFDVYLPNSLKAATREKRGKGIRRRVAAANKCPGNWMQFLKDAINKKELNEYLAETLSALSYPQGRELFVTSQEKVLSNCGTAMPDSDQEEADSRLLLHAKSALSQNMTFVYIISNDTDVIIIALGVYHKLCSEHIFDDMVIEFGIGQHERRISVKSLAESLGQTRSQAMVFFHSFTGTDTTSSFRNIGKKRAYEAFKAYSEIEQIFSDFHVNPFPNFDEEHEKFKKIQRFVILMYSKTSLLHNTDEARLDLYFSRSQNIENIPPTKNALFLHTRRALYQSGVWSRCLEAQQNLPSPKDFGWLESSDQVIKWIPNWMSQFQASIECREFVKCGCQTSCTSSKRCKCNSADLKCTRLCKCKCLDKVMYE